LRDDGVSFGDYLGQISLLLFLKMDDERVHYLGEPSALPDDSRWTGCARYRANPWNAASSGVAARLGGA